MHFLFHFYSLRSFFMEYDHRRSAWPGHKRCTAVDHPLTVKVPGPGSIKMVAVRRDPPCGYIFIWVCDGLWSHDRLSPICNGITGADSGCKDWEVAEKSWMDGGSWIYRKTELVAINNKLYDVVRVGELSPRWLTCALRSERKLLVNGFSQKRLFVLLY